MKYKILLSNGAAICTNDYTPIGSPDAAPISIAFESYGDRYIVPWHSVVAIIEKEQRPA